MDDTAIETLALLAEIPVKKKYTREDVKNILDQGYDKGILCIRLFLGLSKDAMETALSEILSPGLTGALRYKREWEVFLDALDALGVPEQMAATINYQPVWSDILKERLRSGRGSAIQGQKRGRELENFVEELVKAVFGNAYEARCSFTGADGELAKCDFAIPNKNRPQIVVEAKAYNATGSKMTDIIGDLDAIIKSKRHDTRLLFVTDGSTWRARRSDLRKIVERQNQGKIARIYTMKMAEELLSDLQSLKTALRL
ncbi:DpnII family type II restriction endonuclease [Sphingomonas trueperi]|uniref:DpnII family type II restriction endonuclease n=1 Tax=Sphingomonas trueperi TaxID=53317 RepID=UPI001C7D6A05